jgi:cell division septum initiation protein DivIVA
VPEGKGGQAALGEPDIAPPPPGEDTDGPESNFDTVRRGFAPDQVAGYLKRVATSVLSLESRIEGIRFELLEARMERDEARAALEAADPNVAASQHVTELVRGFDDQVGGLIRDAEEEAGRVQSDVRAEAGRILAKAREEADRIVAEARAEAERTRADVQTEEQEARIRAARSIYQARQETDRASRDLSAMKETMLETFRGIRDRAVVALDEVEAAIEKEAVSDPVVIVEDADELASSEVPQVPRPDL